MNKLLSIQWNVSPEAFSVGPFIVRYYGLFFVVAFVAATYVFYYMVVQKERKSIFLVPIALNAVFLASLIGARLGECLFYYPNYYLQHPWEIILPFRDGQFIGIAGLSSHGAAMAIPIALYLVCRNNRISYIWLLDRVAVAIALAAVFIRIGNLMNSEIVGVETSLPWGFVFVQLGENVSRHPVQLYEAIAYLLIFIFLVRFYLQQGKQLAKGMLTGLFLVLIFTARFFIEYLKAPVYEAKNLPLISSGQYLSLPIILIGTIFLMMAVMLGDSKE